MNLYLKKARKSILIILLLLPGANIYAQQNSKITIINKDISIQTALMEVRKQSKMSVVYNDSKLPKLNISLNINKQPLEKALDNILQGTNFTYMIKNNYIIIVPKEEVKNTKTKKITGKVVDLKGEDLIGVSIMEKGTANGTVTDINGNYTLNVSSTDAVLAFSYIGYKTQVVNTKGKTSLNITLAEESKILSEVVVTALGIKREQKALSYRNCFEFII